MREIEVYFPYQVFLLPEWQKEVENEESNDSGRYWNFGLGVNNLFDIQYYDHLTTLKQLGFCNQGREMSFRLRIPFKIVKND